MFSGFLHFFFLILREKIIGFDKEVVGHLHLMGGMYVQIRSGQEECTIFVLEIGLYQILIFSAFPIPLIL